MDLYTRLRMLATDLRETLRWYSNHGNISPQHIDALRHLHYGVARSLSIVDKASAVRDHAELMAVYGIVGGLLASIDDTGKLTSSHMREVQAFWSVMIDQLTPHLMPDGVFAKADADAMADDVRELTYRINGVLPND